jgi:hypothetical protein
MVPVPCAPGGAWLNRETFTTRRWTVWRWLQLFGAACLGVVVLTHVAERLELFPSMGWGLPDSAGHSLDLVSAILGLTLLPVGIIGSLVRTKG